MLGHLHHIDGTVRGMGFLVDKNKPFVSFLVRNWWLVGIAGIAIVGRVMERRKKKELTVFNTVADVGFIISPLVGLALLNQVACQEHAVAQAAAGIPQAPGSIPTPPMPS